MFNVIRCENLIAADENGYSDPFVEVSFDGIRLRTASKRMDLNPTFNKVLFLPLQFVDKSVESLRRKPRIEVRVYDADDTGNDILGSVKIRTIDFHPDIFGAHSKKSTTYFPISFVFIRFEK